MTPYTKEQYEHPSNQNRDVVIIGTKEVEKCKCEMPAKIKDRKMCFRCKKYLS